MSNEVVSLLVRVMVTSFVLMAVIMICCIATPYIAKWIDKKRPRPTQGDGSEPSPEQNVKGPFDAQSDPEYDLNYKIYNKDIYGVDFKNGKEK